MKKDPPGELTRRLTVGNTLQWASMLPRRELQNSQVPLNSETWINVRSFPSKNVAEFSHWREKWEEGEKQAADEFSYVAADQICGRNWLFCKTGFI